MKQFEIKIVNELCGVPDEMSPDTSLIASLKVAINFYECIVEYLYFSYMRLENSNFMKRPWWMFWKSKEEYFREQYILDRKRRGVDRNVL